MSPNDLSAEKDPNEFETFMAEYRLKLDELESLIANLTATQFPSSNSNTDPKPTVETKITWMNMIDARLKLAKSVIYKFTYRPTVTVTKYLPTGKTASSFDTFISFF